MRLEPNLSILFAELPLLARPRAAAQAGFDAAELWWPFEQPDPGPTAIDELARAFEEAGVTLACLNLYGGDFSIGERGALSVPRYREAFQANITPAMRLAERLQCPTLNALFGDIEDSEAARGSEALAVANLADAAAAAASIGARVVIEALNPVDHPTYGLPRVEDVVAFLDRARDEQAIEAWCSLDVYHVERAGGVAAAAIERNGSRIGHVQLGDMPGRCEPGTGSIDFLDVLRSLRRVGYGGWVGLEYVPPSDTHASLRRVVRRLRGPGEEVGRA